MSPRPARGWRRKSRKSRSWYRYASAPKGRIKPRHAAGLQRHLATDFAGIEVAAVAGIFHGAPVHDREIVAEFAGKVEILLDQDDRDFAEAAQIGDCPPDVLDDRGLDALGRLVQQQQFWPHHQ